MAKISVYDAGYAGDMEHLRGYREVTAGSGTFPGNPLEQHFGTSASGKYDVDVVFPSGQKVEQRGISVGKTLTIIEKN